MAPFFSRPAIDNCNTGISKEIAAFLAHVIWLGSERGTVSIDRECTGAHLRSGSLYLYKYSVPSGTVCSGGEHSVSIWRVRWNTLYRYIIRGTLFGGDSLFRDTDVSLYVQSKRFSPQHSQFRCLTKSRSDVDEILLIRLSRFYSLTGLKVGPWLS